MSSDLPLEIEHRRLSVGEVTLHVASVGSGPNVLLLHGFPDLWFTFESTMLALARAGFRALAPDLRGYGASDRPKGVRAYRIECLLRDLEGLIDALGGGPVSVVGHDWGGLIAYAFASAHPERVARLVIENAPHPERLRRELLWGFQALRLWYVPVLQLPLLAELLLPRRWLVAWMLRAVTAQREAFSASDIDRRAAAFREPGAARAAANYYRAWLRWPVRARRTIGLPTLIVWGERDPALGKGLTRGLERYITDLELELVADAGHFVHLEASERFAARVVAFLRGATT